MNADEFHIRRRNDERYSAKRDTNFFVGRALQQVGFLVLETLPSAEHLRKRGFAIERVDATEDIPVADLLVFLMVDGIPSARHVYQ